MNTKTGGGRIGVKPWAIILDAFGLVRFLLTGGIWR